MLKYLRSVDWRDLAASAFVLATLIAIVSPSSVNPPQQTAIERGGERAETKRPEIGAAERADDLIARYTLWLALFTGGLIVVSGGQVYFLTRADKTARIAAEAARDTVRKMDETAERQLRAYVLVSGGKILDISDPAKRRAQVSIRNFGQTPAHDLRVWVGVVTRELPLRTILGVPPSAFPMSADVLPPSRPSVMIVPVSALNAWEERELRENRAAIYVFGGVTYTDVFNKHRTTNFRHMCHGEGLPSGGLMPCEEGNKYT